MLQLEGSKHWKLWAPTGTEYVDTLAREYSKDFTMEDTKKMTQLADVVIEVTFYGFCY